MKYLKDVFDFHEKFNIPQPTKPGFPEMDIVEFRMKFIQEEAAEIQEAIENDDLEGVLDGLCDLVYVALGMALMFGLDFDAAWQRVQDANMKKVSGVASDRHPMFDVTKPEGWTPPDHSDLVDPEHERGFPSRNIG